MLLSRLKVENYRALRDVTIPLSNLACVIGENNGGKSSLLVALSLLITGNKLSKDNYYNPEAPIRIEALLTDISERDLARLAPEHRERIGPIVVEGKLTLVRRYEADGTATDLYYRALYPRDPRFNQVSARLAGTRGAAVRNAMQELFPEYADRFAEAGNQGQAKDIVAAIVREMNEADKEEQDTELPIGIPNAIRPLLPEPILIPAVKDINDDVKAKESATLGKLVAVLLEVIEKTEEVQAVVQSFETLRGLLNKTLADDGTEIDNRLDRVKDMERAIGDYLRVNFPTTKLELSIPPPQLKHVFSTAQVMVDDGIKGPADSKGDGLKRAVTFALLRTYIDMKKNQTATATADGQTTPYLFLFEEPELYLHPGAQRILFEALGTLSANHQVVITTHSPMFLSPTTTGTFVKLKKRAGEGFTPYSEAIPIDLSDIDKRNLFQILCFENCNAAFFTSRVVLVEGDSDHLFFKHVAKLFRPEWDFDARNIAVVRVFGKGNVRRYREFFTAFDIDVHVIVDLDAVIDGFDCLGAEHETTGIRAGLISALDTAAAAAEEVNLTAEKIREVVGRYTWREKWGRMKELANRVLEGGAVTEEEVIEMGLLFDEEVKQKRRAALQAAGNEIPEKARLLEALRSEQIYVLSKGTVEEYYPPGVTGDDKPSKALDACARLETRENVCAVCPLVPHNGQQVPELEAMLDSIFSPSR